MHQYFLFIREGIFTCQTFWGCCLNNSHKIHLKVALGFNGFLDLTFLCIADIWHDVQKGYISILSSISHQKFAVSPSIYDLVDLCLNIWCNNPRATFFLGDTLFYLSFFWFLLKMHVSSVHYMAY